MGTARHFFCRNCGEKRRAGNLFKALSYFSQQTRCFKCRSPVHLKLNFNFGLGATDSEFTVLDCFKPSRPQWWYGPGSAKTTFHPFLVVLHRRGRKEAAWLPYWHVVKKGRNKIIKYGQWAPLMDFYLFEDLIYQAKAKGYFKTKVRNLHNGDLRVEKP